MSEFNSNLIDSLDILFPNKIQSSMEFRGESTIYIDKSSLMEICNYLKNEYGFVFLVDLTAVDYLGIKFPRFEVVYYLHRFGDGYEDNSRIRLKIQLSEEDLEVESVTPIWNGADWLEREVYDMYGILFSGHPDLRRILMPEDYDEFPLRKDFDVRNREPSKRSFHKALEDGGD